MKRAMQITSALVAAAFTATAVYVIATALRYDVTDLSDAMSFATAVVTVAGLLSLLIGLPAHFLFSFVGWNQLWKYALGGACIGLLGGYVLDLMYIEDAISGAAGAAAFWAIAGRVPTAKPASHVQA